MEGRLRQTFANQMGRGELVLFTGAGFSLAARSRSGEPIPSVRKLKELLWPIAFHDLPFDDQSSLGDIFQCGVNKAGGKVREVLSESLQVDAGTLPKCYRYWLEVPWSRIYTLNVDDLENAGQVAFNLPTSIRSLSALTDSLPDFYGESVLYIHLNGQIRNFPNLTFSQRNYAARLVQPDPWYQHLVTDLSSHPVVYVGTVLDETPFWQHIELRRNKQRGSREMRPGSYLVTPSLPEARRALLEQFNVQLVKMTQEEFATEVLAPMSEERARGHTVRQNRVSRKSAQKLLQSVSVLRTQGGDGSAEFLLGREPDWPDIVDGIAIGREFESELNVRMEETQPRVLLLTGTAGSGKSTTLRRLALEFHATGKDVAWLDLDQSEIGLHRVIERVVEAEPEAVAIDDADILGENVGQFLSSLAEASPNLLILAAMRSTRFQKLAVDAYFQEISHLVYSIPHLEDSDIEGLLDALTKANRLGKLKALSRNEQVGTFRDIAGRQLLVAMIEATSGERFDEKIAEECKDLGTVVGFVYATVAIATSLRSYLTRDEIYIAMNDSTNEAFNTVESLVRQKLLVDRFGQLRVRHRVVADRAVDYYRKEGLLSDPIQGLLWTIATKVRQESPRYSREKRLLRYLVNHQFMINITSNKEIPRKAYALVEDILKWDYHYWLQRGSFEVEIGNISLAKNFLDQAKSMAPTDYMVQTEWAYMILKRAAQNASTSWARDSASEAIAQLEEAIERRGKQDPYPYHVLGSQGLSWARRAIISRSQKRMLLERLHHFLKQGLQRHPRRSELQQLASDLHKEILLTTVVDDKVIGESE